MGDGLKVLLESQTLDPERKLLLLLAVYKHCGLLLALGKRLGLVKPVLPVLDSFPCLLLSVRVSAAPFTLKAKPKVGVPLLLAHVLDRERLIW